MKEKRIIYLIMGVSSILILLIGITTAWFTWQSETNTNVTFEVSGLNITSTNTNITGTLYPTMDKNNGVVEEFTIKQNNDISTPVCANITLNLTTLPTELNHESFRYKIYNGTNLVGSGNFANTLEGETITIATSQPITTTLSTYKLYIWIDGENYDNPLSMGGKTFLFKLGITANQQQNACNPSTVEELNAPELVSGMIPIKYDGTKWVKASTTTTNDWYDYTNKMWANAVMVTSETRGTYMNASTGTTISEEDILAYYVWIPRYKYQLFNVDSTTMDPIEIQVEFEDGTPTKSTGTSNGEWLTHPAFTFGTDELKGIWVGKFEITGSASSPTIKPGLNILTSTNVYTHFSVSQQFGTAAYLNNMGVSQVDAHLMKNIEWGAVAYLKQSKYGLGLTDIAVNNDNSRITGGGTELSYVTNVAQTTTGNIYGVYDMSGGSDEYVMAASLESGNTSIVYSSSGFTTDTLPFNSKYLDQYNYGSYNDYTRSILGDAMGETTGWYSDANRLTYGTYTWITRGGWSGSGDSAGIFYFWVTKGADDGGNGARSTIAVY